MNLKKVGVVDFFSKLTEGVKNTTTLFEDDNRERIRKPRHFGMDGTVEVYSPSKASAQQLLYFISNNKYLDEKQKYLRHILLVNHILLFTNKYLLFVKYGSKTEEWHVPFSKIKNTETNEKHPEILLLNVDKLTFSERKTLASVKQLKVLCVYQGKNIISQVEKIIKQHI